MGDTYHGNQQDLGGDFLLIRRSICQLLFAHDIYLFVSIAFWCVIVENIIEAISLTSDTI